MMNTLTSFVSRLIDNIKAVIMFILMVLAVAYIKLQVYWSDLEIAVGACATLMLIIGIVLLLRSHGLSSIWKRDGDGTAVPFKWVEEMTERYRPGRRSWALPVGLDENGMLKEIQMIDTECHVALTAKSGSGKSTLLNQMILAAANSGFWQVVVLSMSGKDFVAVSKHRNVHLMDYEENLAAYVRDVPKIVEAAEEEINRRMALLKHYGVSEVEALRKSQRPPLILLVIEEFPHLIESIRLHSGTSAAGAKAQRDFLARISLLVKRGRAVGLRCLFVAQRATTVIPNVIRHELIHITFKVHNKQESQWATGIGDANAHKLQRLDKKKGKPGQVIMVGSHEIMRLTVPWITAQDMNTVLRHYRDEVPFTGSPTWIPGIEPDADELADNDQPQQITTIQHEIAGSTPARSPESWLVEQRLELERLYGQNSSFSETPVALTDHRFVAMGLCLLSGMKPTHVEVAIFKSRKGSYLDRVNQIAGLLGIEDEAADEEE